MYIEEYLEMSPSDLTKLLLLMNYMIPLIYEYDHLSEVILTNIVE